jgi:hypothetical protein
MAKSRQLPKQQHSRKIAISSVRKGMSSSKKQRPDSASAEVKGKAGSILKKLRKPMAPPTRVEEDERNYNRARSRERMRREQH